MTTWAEMLDYFEDDIQSCTATEEELNMDFDDSYGRPEGQPFYAWSEKWVYFCCTYDGSEWLERIPRNPIDPENWRPTHVGGW